MLEKVDIVIPVYMAGTHLLTLIDNLLNVNLGTDYQLGEVILVLDGQLALTEEVTIQRLLNQYTEQIKILELHKNYGQYTATYIGLLNAKGDWVITMDDDGQHDPDFIASLLLEKENTGADLVYARYNEVKQKPYRIIGSNTLRSIMKWSHPESMDASSFRLIHSTVLKNLSNNPIQSAFLDEDLWQAAHHYAVVEAPHLDSHKAKSSYSKLKLLKQAVNLILFHTSLPLKWMTRLGMLMGVVFFIIGLYRIYLKWTQDIALGFTSLIVAIFFSTSLLLISLGIIGEYIRRIWVHQQGLNKVNYTIHASKS